MKSIIFDTGITQSRALILDDNKLTDLYIENHDDISITGNIYKGIVENIVPGLSAAFINIGLSKNVMLHFDDINKGIELKKGNEVVVQVIRESSGNKCARVTTKLSIPSKNIVLLPDTNEINISQKIASKEIRNNLESLGKDLITNNLGIIFRTEAMNISNENIKSEYEILKQAWDEILKSVQYLKPPKLIFDSKNFYNFVIREYLKKDIEKVYYNRPEELNLVKHICNLSITNKQLEFEYINSGLLKLIDNEIEKINSNKISLPSGGYLIMDKTEAFVTIDVNSGQYIDVKTKDEMAYKINMEACDAIFKIIKLRNFSGIILIDFIDMVTTNYNESILNHFTSLMKNDKNNSKVYGFTKLGILELTRSRKSKSIDELVYTSNAKVEFTTSYILKRIENECLKLNIERNISSFDILINPLLFENANKKYKNYTNDFNNIYKININLIKSDLVKDYIINLDDKFNKVKVELNNKKIYGRLLEFSELENNEIAIKLKKY